MFHIPLKFSYMCVCVWQTLLVSPLNMPLTMCAQVWVTRKPLCGGRCLHICLMHFSSYKCPECPQYPFIHTQWCPQTVDLGDPSGLSPGKRLCASRDTKVSFTWFGLFTLQAGGTGYTLRNVWGLHSVHPQPTFLDSEILLTRWVRCIYLRLGIVT